MQVSNRRPKRFTLFQNTLVYLGQGLLYGVGHLIGQLPRFISKPSKAHLVVAKRVFVLGHNRVGFAGFGHRAEQLAGGGKGVES